jgi:hypothetical protein
MTTERILVRNVIAGATFDGVTGETSRRYSPAPTQNTRSFKSGPTVGRFGFGAQGRKGLGMALVKVRVYGPIIAGDRVEIRSGISGDTPVGDRDNQPVGTTALGPVEPGQGPQDALLEVFDLANNFTDARWHRLGPTDAICIYHQAGPDGDTAELLIVEGDESELGALECGGACECDCFVPTVAVSGTHTGRTPIDPWSCDINLVLTPLHAGEMFTLPPAGGMTQGATAFVRRAAGSPWCVVTGGGGDPVNGRASPEGIVFEDDDRGVLFRLTANGWIASDNIPQLTPQSLAASVVPVFAGDAVFDLDPDTPDVQLPSTTDIAPGQMLWLTNRSSDRRPITLRLANPGTENLDGTLSASMNLPNVGDTALLLRDGARGWRSVWNLWDRDRPLQLNVTNPLALTTGWRGTQSYALSSADPNIDISLPLPNVTPVGCRVHAYRTDEGTLTFDAQGANRIVGAGASAQTLVVDGAHDWGFLEFEGTIGGGVGIWSYQCSGTAQARDTIVLADNSPVPLAALARDVTIVMITCNAVGGTVTLPSINTADRPRVLKLMNNGTEELSIQPAPGCDINGVPALSITLRPGTGVELQPFSTTRWHAGAGATPI